MVSFLQSSLLLFHFCVFLSQLSELVWKLAEEISLQSASKCFQSFGPPANGNKSNAKKSRFCPNRNLTGTIYHWSVILRSFSVVLNSAKRDANGFFKVLLLSSHLLISRHPVRKSKFGACAVTGYCSFNINISRKSCLSVFLQGWKSVVRQLKKPTESLKTVEWMISMHLCHFLQHFTKMVSSFPLYGSFWSLFSNVTRSQNEFCMRLK